MKLMSAVNKVFKNFNDKTSILYSNIDESVSISYKDVTFASEQVKLKLLPTETCNSVNSVCEFIAVCTHLNYLYPVCICGILLSGRQFVCIDVMAPFDWNQNLVEQLGVTTILSTETCAVKLTQCFTSLVCEDTFDVLGLKLNIWKTGYKSKALKDSLLYAMQTSGSTGQPKIVYVPETCILPNINQLRNEFQVTHEDVILSASPFTFDPSIIELFLAFTSGATLFMVSDNVKAIPNVYLNILFPANKPGTGITILQMTPSVFRRWSSEDISKKILGPDSRLKVLALGGEQFPEPDYFTNCRSPENKTKIYNLYGTTEVSCWAMMSKELGGYLGSAMEETVIHVHDSNGSVITEGTGELFIGSHSRICIVDNETELDTKKPVFRPSGDLVHVTNNKYKYLGRKDNMIKRWGHRVSLDEVATCALQCEGVSTAYCVLDKKENLVLFVNSDVGVKTFLRNKLKKASVPDVILVIPSFPLSKHGKTDKSVLKMMANDHFDLENKNKNISRLEYFKILWERYTDKSCVTTLGFLDCGGNSISALQIATEMSYKFINISADLLTHLLQNKGVEECCELLANFSFDNIEINSFRRKLDDSSEIKNKKLKKVSESCTVCVQFRGQHFGEILKEGLCEVPSRLTCHKAWQCDLGKCIDASPTLIHYRNRKLSLVSVGSHSGKLAAFELHGGEQIWQLTLADRIESSVHPTKDGKFGIVGCYDGNVYCIDLTSGHISWTVRTAAMVKCTPLVHGNSAFIGSYDHHVYCIDTENGKVTWAYNTSASVFASPLYSDKHNIVLISNLGGRVVALNPDTGTLRWNLMFNNPIFSTPTIISWEQEDHLILAEVNGAVSCITVTDGRQIWNLKAEGNIFSSLTSYQYSEISFYIMFGCHDHNIYCLKATETSTELIWKTNIGSPVYSTPTIASPLPCVIAASTEGCICVLDIISGEIKYKYNLPGQIFSSPVIFESKIVVGCRDNIVYCLTINL